ncbi:hypothetical protein [Clostridium sp. DL1XJH146]
MKKLNKFMGAFFLSLCSLFVITGAASLFGVGMEDMPESIKEQR